MSKEEIKRKIVYLENSIALCYIRSGPRYCINREARVRAFKLMGEKDEDKFRLSKGRTRC